MSQIAEADESRGEVQEGEDRENEPVRVLGIEEPLHADSGRGTLGTEPASWRPTAAADSNLLGLMDMDQDAIIQYITDTFTGIEVVRPTDGPGAGDTFFFYDPQHDLDPKRRMPFATIVAKDYGDFDNASQLNRPDVFRLNIGVSRDTFRALIGHAPGEDSTESADYDFAALDRLMPHPVYAPQSFVCVLNPSPETFELVKPLLAEAHSIAATRHASRQSKRD